MKETSIIDKLFGKSSKAEQKQYYVHGSGLVPIPAGRLNEIPKVIQEFHELEAARARLAGTVRRVTT